MACKFEEWTSQICRPGDTAPLLIIISRTSGESNRIRHAKQVLPAGQHFALAAT